MIKVTVTPQITGTLRWELIQLENQRKIQKDYPLTDTLPKNIETYTLGLLLSNDYYNDFPWTNARKYKIIFISSIRSLDGSYLAEFHQPMAIKKKMSCFNDTSVRLSPR